MASGLEDLSLIASRAVTIARALGTTAVSGLNLAEPSIDEARQSLRWLRNLALGEKDTEGWLLQSGLDEQIYKAKSIARLIEIYAGLLKIKPDMATHPILLRAHDAAGGLALALADFSLEALPDESPAVRPLEALLQPILEAWEMREGQAVFRLLDALAAGIEYLAGNETAEKIPAEKWMEAEERIKNAASQLQSVDSMQPPAREESIELAREILRRLKNMSFADKTIEEMMSVPGDEGKEFALKLEEMVDSYRQILAEALTLNPDLMLDPLVKEASDTAGCFAHAVALMAAREIPGSMADVAQQISADIEEMPEQWKKLQGHAIGKLVKSMESGLEKAVGEISRHQEQQPLEDQAKGKENAEQQPRRKRKRRGPKPDVTGSRQRKLVEDLTADDYVLKQGRFRRESAPAFTTPTASAPAMPKMPKLRPEDLAAVKALGGSLHNASKKAGEIKTPDPKMTGVAAGDKIAPDDKKFAEKSKDQRDKQKPKGIGS